jgi:Uncharacterized protein conserved in bacteria (DUF2252)
MRRADRRALFDQYRLVDMARKVVGVGSVGTRCYILLLQGPNGGPLFLQAKEVMGARVTVESVGLEANEPVEGSVLLELASVASADPVQRRGEVRHVARMTGGGVHVGIGFIALSAQAEQLLDLLFALRAAH